MPQEGKTLERTLNIGEPVSKEKRQAAITQVRNDVTNFTGETMRLAAVFVEITKNVIDHAGGRGSFMIRLTNGAYEFTFKDEGTETHDLALCRTTSRLAGNGVNHGVGLSLIEDMSKTLGIDLKIDTSRGFCYSGVYRPATEPASN